MMKWRIIIVMVGIACATGLISASQITTEVGIEESGLAETDAAPYERSPAKLKKLIDTHRLFHKKIKITFAGLVDDLKPYLANDDIAELSEIVETILDQYDGWVNKADEALQVNDIELADNLLMKVAKELENIYIAQEMIINFKQEIAPQAIPAIEQKNNKIIA